MNRRIVTAALLAGTALLAACKKEPPASLPPDPTPTATSSTTSGGDTGAAALGTQAHFESAVNGQNVIYFDTDKFDIDSADAAALQTQAAYLQQYPQISVTVEGHADERGTREYNIALGARRAQTVRDYLSARGVQVSRMRTISYGKERPVAVCDDISCWSQNRRAVTVLNAAQS